MEATSSTKQVCGSIWQFVFYLSEVSQILETRRCPSMPSITDGVIGNSGKVPICFEMSGKILQPCRILASTVATVLRMAAGGRSLKWKER